MGEKVKWFWLETDTVTMQRLRTFVRSTGGIQWRLLRSGGGDVNAMARAIEVPNGLRGHHSEGTPPTSDEQVSCCNDKQRKPDHPGKGDESRKDDICHFLDRQLLYDEEEEPGNDANEDNSTVCAQDVIYPHLRALSPSLSFSILLIHCTCINTAYCVMLCSLRNILYGIIGNWTTSWKIIECE